jgi:hypothetical protein
VTVNAIDRCNALEAALMARVGSIYADALRTATKKRAAFLRKIEAIDEGRIKPPQYYIDTDQVDKWRQGFVRELIRQENVIEGIMEELNRAGVQAADEIKSTMPEYYAINREEAVELLSDGMHNAGLDGSFRQQTRRQIETILTDLQPPFSRLAYQNLGRNPAIRRRLEHELSQATILGESQEKLIKRIMAVTGQAQWQAKRVAQTERTRVQSQARWDAGNEAMALGVRVINEWSARMINTRDTHAELDGKVALQGEYFPGSPLRFPGDPSAPAGEVINCHCVMIPDVLREGQMVVNGKVVG